MTVPGSVVGSLLYPILDNLGLIDRVFYGQARMVR